MTTDNLKTDFDEICKRTIIPFFKDFGFKRKTLHFARQIKNITQCFNVQKSQWNSYDDSMTFTFNFGFYNSDIAEIISDKKTQLEFPKTYDCFIQNRLGHFSHNRDHWYKLAKNIDKNEVAGQIKNDLSNHLKPLFDSYVSLQTLKEFIDKDENHISPTLSPYYLIAFYMLTDQKEKGVKTIKEKYKDALRPQTVTETINFPDGRKEVKTKTYINQFYIDGIERLAKLYNVQLDKNASR